MKTKTTTYHCAFGRYSIVREIAAKNKECSWCGQCKRAFRYGQESDGYGAHTVWDSKTFCCKTCRDSYYN